MSFNKRIISTAVVAAVASLALGQTIVVPNALTNVDGNGANRFPFDPNAASMRYQQVYNSDQFNTGPIFIDAILFRPDPVSGVAFTTTVQDVQINMSTSSNGADGLSTTFANNTGADDQIVRSRGSMTISSANTGGSPRDFDILITFDSAFTYDPSAGNLLLDVRQYSGETNPSVAFWDAESTVGDSISRVYTHASGVDSPTADNINTLGLVTQFQYRPVPEPASMIALGLGAAALLARRRRKSA